MKHLILAALATSTVVFSTQVTAVEKLTITASAITQNGQPLAEKKVTLTTCPNPRLLNTVECNAQPTAIRVTDKNGLVVFSDINMTNIIHVKMNDSKIRIAAHLLKLPAQFAFPSKLPERLIINIAIAKRENTRN